MDVVSTEVDFVVVNSTAVDLHDRGVGQRFGFSFYPYVTTMMTTLTTIRMAIIRMSPAIHMLTTAVAM